MQYDDYEKISITRFRGLYKRGMPDECPPDHAICCENCTFTKAGEVSQRWGISASQFTGASSIIRDFLALTNNGTFLLTCDGIGNIYSNGSGTPLYSAAGMYDFSAFNAYGRTYILPILSGGGSPPPLQVFNGLNIRPAAGTPPGSAVTANDGSAGNVDAGVYQISYSFITDSGFVTPPAPLAVYTAPGALKIDLTGISVGPAGTVARQILVSRANQEELFFLPSSDGGVINDNTTTAATINFFDTDLVLSADYLFDLLPVIPGSNITGTINFYHNRLVILNLSTNVKVSRVQDVESFNQVDGVISFPSYGISSAMYGVCVQRDILYITKFPGIYGVQDNGQEPAFWTYVLIDGGFGSLAPGIGSLSGTDNALTASQVFLMCDRNGVFKFDGAIEKQALTWKIDDLWKQINFSSAAQFVSLFIDVVHDTFYVLAPIGSATFPNMLLMCDYSEGMDSDNVKWSLFTFPYVPSSITFINFEGNLEIGQGGYFLRVTFYNQPYVFALKPQNTNDQGAAINASYRTFLASPNVSALNTFRSLKFRAIGSGNLGLVLDAQDFNPAFSVQPLPIPLQSLASADVERQINYAYKEKMSVGFGTGAFVNNPNSADTFTIQRLDIFCSTKVQTRPQ